MHVFYDCILGHCPCDGFIAPGIDEAISPLNLALAQVAR